MMSTMESHCAFRAIIKSIGDTNISLSATAYNYGKKEFYSGSVDFTSDTMKIALLVSAYSPDIDANQYWTDVSASEVAGTGYTAGGYTLLNPSATMDATNDMAYFNADDPTWTSATLTSLRYAVLYKDTGDAATSPIFGFVNFGENKSLTNGTFTLTVSATGLMQLT